MNDELFYNLEIKNENEILLIKEFFNEIIKRLIEKLKDKKGIVNIIRQIIESSDINNILDYLLSYILYLHYSISVVLVGSFFFDFLAVFFGASS